MPLNKTENGKAYEYACLIAFKEYLTEKGIDEIITITSDAYNTAKKAFDKAKQENESDKLVYAAKAAVRVITRLEPQLEHGNGTLTLSIQTDSKGIAGDVRDIVFIRDSTGWEIGVSCKHNHHAVKHSRLSATIDFGKEWLGFPCSQQYFDTIVPIFHELRDMKANAVNNNLPLPLWSDIPNKSERYYVPILNAFLIELNRLATTHPNVPGKLIKYMLGRYDFYKVITDDRHRTTRVEAINLAGTLNRPANGHRSIVDISKLKLPSRFYHMGIVPDSDNKIEIICDLGWALTMRIHNASNEVEPSLKFDVQLASLPSSIHVQVEPW